MQKCNHLVAEINLYNKYIDKNFVLDVKNKAEATTASFLHDTSTQDIKRCQQSSWLIIGYADRICSEIEIFSLSRLPRKARSLVIIKSDRIIVLHNKVEKVEPHGTKSMYGSTYA